MAWMKQLWLETREQFLDGDESVREDLVNFFDDPLGLEGLSATFDFVAAYHARGWSIVPQLPGAKSPCLPWKPHQERQPDVAECAHWWYHKWPDAGIAVILGPVSGLFVIDVDGEEAHLALIDKLGSVPVTPQVRSGSGKLHRYHLFFRYPDVDTKAKSTPWCKMLEFRGQRGIVIVPPSLHKSGNRYSWVGGRSLDDVPLADVPPQILEALQQQAARRDRQAPPDFLPQRVPVRNLSLIPLARTTREFLQGKFASGPDWNGRLFRSSCDLAGNGIPKEIAEPLLIAGAQPWNAAERDAARATIASAFSENRVPAQKRHQQLNLPPGTPPEIARRFERQIRSGKRQGGRS